MTVNSILYDDIPDAPLPGGKRVLGIGVYDGVHQGHQAVIRHVLDEARTRGLRSMLLTFDRLPEELLRPEVAPKRLMSLPEKLDALAALGPEEILVAHVKPELLGQTPEEFAEKTLCGKIRPRLVVVGEDFRYGKGGKGNAETLAADGERWGYEVRVVPHLRTGEEKVSSTRIRSLLAEGQVEAAAQLLTRPYRLNGRVVSGNRLGRTLGYPTANLEIAPTRMIPGNGIYACRAVGENFARDAAVSIGVRPTVGPDLIPTVEAFLLDFEGDIYGQELELEFIARLRDEAKFPSLDALKDQMSKDVIQARTILSPSDCSIADRGCPD